MYELPQSFMERFWLMALRLTWKVRNQGGRNPARLIDRLARQADLPPMARPMRDLLSALERCGADHLYIEEADRPGVTGDERDLLSALRAVYCDDLLHAEDALSALVAPGRTERLIRPLRAVARPRRRLDGYRQMLQRPLIPAACH